MGLNDLWEASVRQEYSGEEVVNVFHLHQLTGTGSAGDLALRILNQWITANWEALVSVGVSFVEIAVRNLYDANQQTVFPLGVLGTKGGEGMPPHDAVQTRANTNLPTVTGSKRFAGISELDQVTGRLNAAVVTAWDNFVNGVINFPLIGSGGTLVYQYVIVKRIPYTTSSGSKAYRLPTNQAEAVYGQVISGTVNDVIRTQKSRDYQE